MPTGLLLLPPKTDEAGRGLPGVAGPVVVLEALLSLRDLNVAPRGLSKSKRSRFRRAKSFSATLKASSAGVWPSAVEAASSAVTVCGLVHHWSTRSEAIHADSGLVYRS